MEIESSFTAVVGQFPGAVREPNGEIGRINWSAEDEQASFQVEWSEQYLVVSCRQMSNEDMNRLINIAVDHDCRLYDPQVNERFA